MCRQKSKKKKRSWKRKFKAGTSVKVKGKKGEKSAYIQNPHENIGRMGQGREWLNAEQPAARESKIEEGREARTATPRNVASEVNTEMYGQPWMVSTVSTKWWKKIRSWNHLHWVPLLKRQHQTGSLGHQPVGQVQLQHPACTKTKRESMNALLSARKSKIQIQRHLSSTFNKASKLYFNMSIYNTASMGRERRISKLSSMTYPFTLAEVSADKMECNVGYSFVLVVLQFFDAINSCTSQQETWQQ